MNPQYRFVLLLVGIVVLSGAPPFQRQVSAQFKKDASQKGRDEELLVACTKGDAQKVQALLKQGANVNGRDASKTTPLMRAALAGHLEVMKILIAKGADINASNGTGFTALHLAAGYGGNDCVRYLLQKGAKINVGDRHGNTPRELAHEEGHLDTEQILIKAGGNVMNTINNVASNAPKDHLEHVSEQLQREMQPYLKQAKETYPAAKKRYLAGLPTGQSFFITVALSDGGKKFEEVFVAVRSIKEGVVDGVIASDVTTVKGYKAGDSYRFPESALRDWTITHPDGTEEGNVVGNFIESFQKRQNR